LFDEVKKEKALPRGRAFLRFGFYLFFKVVTEETMKSLCDEVQNKVLD
jgi:hypothetical protein